MECPCCGETIKEEALFCHFCQKDLSLYKPVLHKVEQLNATINELKSRLDMLSAEEASNSNTLGNSNLVQITISLLLSVGLSFVIYWISWQRILIPMHLAGVKFWNMFIFLSSSAPFIGALWLGLCTVQLGLMKRALLGLLAGILGFVQMFFVFHSNAFMFDRVFFLLNKTPYLENAPIYNLPIVFASYVVAGICLYLAGYAAGERLRNRSHTKQFPEANTDGTQTWLLKIGPMLVQIIVALIGFLSSFINVWASVWASKK
jgi:hypothetical protein